MNKKVLIIIVVVTILVLATVGAVLIITQNIDSKNLNENKVIGNTSNKPVITIDKVFDEKNPSKLTLIVYATAEKDEEIEEIVLPNGEIVVGSTANYDVKKNDTYKFIANSSSGNQAETEVEVTEIEDSSANNPFLPKGFKVVEEDISKGRVIEDSYKNQYVWVPVKSGKAVRNISSTSDYKEIESTALEFSNSVAKNYGFYIARYEGSKYEKGDQIGISSKEDETPWTNISYTEALEYAKNSNDLFKYTDCTVALINSYAWDSTMEWIDEAYPNYSSSTSYGNYSGTVSPTGGTEIDKVNNIYDLAGNVREWTTEMCGFVMMNVDDSKKETKVYQRVVRGGSANLRKTPSSRIYYPENKTDYYWGVRTVIYK